MKLTDILLKLAGKVTDKQLECFSYDAKSQREYLLRFPEPKDDFERSFYQFKCQMFLMGFKHYVVNLLCGALYLYKILTIKHLSVDNVEKRSAVFCINDNNIIPDEIFNEFPDAVNADVMQHSSLCKDDRQFLNRLAKRYPFNFHFRLKCLLKISMYRYLIDKYAPKAFVVSSEYSFTSSVITSYLEEKDIEHINVMHGEKLFFIRDSFFRFNRYYLWHEYYIGLFKRLRAENNNFIVSVPRAGRLSSGSADIEKQFDYTYYLTGETEEEVLRIVGFMQQVACSGHKVSIRPHPRYTNLKGIPAETLENINVENNSSTPIAVSILQTKCVIALYSTVLFQAYNSGVDIAIDDVVRKKYYDKLFELEYIGLSFPHALFSEILKGCEKK